MVGPPVSWTWQILSTPPPPSRRWGICAGPPTPSCSPRRASARTCWPSCGAIARWQRRRARLRRPRRQPIGLAADYDEALGYGTPVFERDKGEDVALGVAERAPSVCPRRRLGLRIVAVKGPPANGLPGSTTRNSRHAIPPCVRVLRDIIACDRRPSLRPMTGSTRGSNILDRTWQPAGCVKLPERRVAFAGRGRRHLHAASRPLVNLCLAG